MIRLRHPYRIAGGVLILDELVKTIALARGWPYVINSGFAFGLGEEVWSWAFLILLLAITIDCAKRGWRAPDLFIVSGGVGNVIDRLWVGGVVDWITLGTMWFNLSDVLISVGVLWIFLSSMKTMRSG